MGFGYIVISCVDSDPNVSGMKDVVHGLSAVSCEVQERGAALQVVMSKQAVDFIIKTFTGFDEVWFFQTMPNIDSQPPSITSDRSLNDITDAFVTDTLSVLPEWMRSSGCAIGFGDGAGLNYAAADVAIPILRAIRSSLVRLPELTLRICKYITSRLRRAQQAAPLQMPGRLFFYSPLEKCVRIKTEQSASWMEEIASR